MNNNAVYYIAEPIHLGGITRVFKNENTMLKFYETATTYNRPTIITDTAKYNGLVKAAKNANIKDPNGWAVRRYIMDGGATK